MKAGSKVFIFNSKKSTIINCIIRGGNNEKKKKG